MYVSGSICIFQVVICQRYVWDYEETKQVQHIRFEYFSEVW